jgi:Predicted glycosyltransferases
MVWIFAIIYNTYPEALRFWKSIKATEYSGLKLCFIDNSQMPIDEEFKSEIEKNSNVIDYFRPSKNLGYFGGAQYGYEKYILKYEIPEWIIVSNVDLVIHHYDFFVRLQSLKQTENLGVIAPSIISKRFGTDSNPQYSKRLSLLKLKFLILITSNWVVNNSYILLSYAKKSLTINKKISSLNESKIKQIYAAHGSFIIFHRNYFQKSGNFKHISFLYGEELFVAENCRKLQLQVQYHPELKIYDFEHVSTGFFKKKRISDMEHQSLKKLVESYY